MRKRDIKPRTQGRRSDNGFISKIKQGLAVLLFATLICGTMMGCGADEGNTQDDWDITGKVIAYVDANGELAMGKVVADHGDTLDMGGFELSQSEILGTATAPANFSSIALAKGRHLDAYGEQFADIEYLHGMVEDVFVSRSVSGESETKAALVTVRGGTNSSGEAVTFRRVIGEDIEIEVIDGIVALVAELPFASIYPRFFCHIPKQPACPIACDSW